jgi:hypothetical protein
MWRFCLLLKEIENLQLDSPHTVAKFTLRSREEIIYKSYKN